MRHLEMIKSQSVQGEASTRDFLTLEDDLPAAVAFGSAGVRERATSVTDVKHETTDDN
jgi:hypothetical protein